MVAVPGWESIASIVILISIILSGIALGIGKALNSKRLEMFGFEELMQSIFNAAILGAALLLFHTTATISTQLSSSISPTKITINKTKTYYICNQTNTTLIDKATCLYSNQTHMLNQLSTNLTSLHTYLGYYRTLNVKLGNVSVTPLAGLNGPEGQLVEVSNGLALESIFLYFLLSFLKFLGSTWFGLLFAFGLVLRSFFFSRRVGSFILAASIIFIVIYPFMLLSIAYPFEHILNAKFHVVSILTTPSYQPLPITDLNNDGVATQLYNLGFKSTFVKDLSYVVSACFGVVGEVLFYSIAVPLVGLVLCLWLSYESSKAFGGFSFSFDLI